MARTNRDQDKKVYLNIVGGRFAERVSEGTEGAVKRYSEKKGENVFEILNDRTSGTIKLMKIEKGDYGKSLQIVMKDVDENYTINIPVESKYFDSFCAKIGSADLSMELELAPYSFVANDGVKKIGMNIYQDGNKLGYYFSKEDPKGKPFPESEKLDEEDWKIYKLSERKFYCNFIETLSVGVSPVVDNNDAEVSTDTEDDLPF